MKTREEILKAFNEVKLSVDIDKEVDELTESLYQEACKGRCSCTKQLEVQGSLEFANLVANKLSEELSSLGFTAKINILIKSLSTHYFLNVTLSI